MRVSGSVSSDEMRRKKRKRKFNKNIIIFCLFFFLFSAKEEARRCDSRAALAASKASQSFSVIFIFILLSFCVHFQVHLFVIVRRRGIFHVITLERYARSALPSLITFKRIWLFRLILIVMRDSKAPTLRHLVA